MNTAVKEKRLKLVNRKGVIFHHNNVTPHTSLATRQKLLRLGWEVMLHPPYTIFISIFAELLECKTFHDNEAVKSHLVQFFADRNQKFYERGIMKLRERWLKVIVQNGKYIID